MYPVPVIVPFNNVVFFRSDRSGIARERRLRFWFTFACASARPMRSVWRRAALPLGARSRDPLDKRGLASGFLRKVWFWGPVHAAPVCCLFGLFVWYMCGAGSVGWCFVFRRLHENVRFRKALKQRGSFRSLPALSMPAAAVVLCDVPRCPGYPASILRPTCSCGDNVHGNCQRGHVCCATIVTR